MMPTVNSSFLRRSGVRNALRKADSNFFLLREAGRRSSLADRGGFRASARYPWLGRDSNSPIPVRADVPGYINRIRCYRAHRPVADHGARQLGSTGGRHG
ncbi:hypothetical protein Van01_09070 [Micromonospora andamanensis]|uniref:Uncharacterized protein n=1 Tax=Micromonospora andamanensis TaxID=1287068 RepID=A0ABQ4HPY2_9ACTN|nr:hypothetical protein Van01_09070 [Micromonospora andamanensis]